MRKLLVLLVVMSLFLFVSNLYADQVTFSGKVALTLTLTEVQTTTSGDKLVTTTQKEPNINMNLVYDNSSGSWLPYQIAIVDNTTKENLIVCQQDDIAAIGSNLSKTSNQMMWLMAVCGYSGVNESLSGAEDVAPGFASFLLSGPIYYSSTANNFPPTKIVLSGSAIGGEHYGSGSDKIRQMWKGSPTVTLKPQ